MSELFSIYKADNSIKQSCPKISVTLTCLLAWELLMNSNM